jgi:CHAT domain-containing protein/Tfp pilus assembly protein PilF
VVKDFVFLMLKQAFYKTMKIILYYKTSMLIYIYKNQVLAARHVLGRFKAGCLLTYVMLMLFSVSTNAQDWQIFDSLSTVHQKNRQFELALENADKAIEIVREKYGENDSLYADMLQNYVFIYYFMEKLEEAINYSTKEKLVREISQGKNHPRYANCIVNLAGIYRQTGEYNLALSLYIEALNIYENLEIKNFEDYGILLNNVAAFYRVLAQYDFALPLALKAVKITEDNLGKTHSNYALCLNNLGLIYWRLGQYEKALPIYLEALEITEKTQGVNHPAYANRLNNLALLYRAMSENEKALKMFIQALEHTERTLGKSHSTYGLRLNNLANLYESMGEYDKALPLLLEALEITGTTLGKEHPTYGSRLNNLANLYRDIEEFDKAIELYLQALDIFEKSLGVEHSTFGIGINNLGSTYERMNNHEEALKLYRQGIENKYININRAFSFLSENEKESFIKTISEDFEVYQNFFLKISESVPEIGADAYNIQLATKGMILQSGIEMRQAILNSKEKDVLEKYDHWAKIRSELSKQYSLPIAMRTANFSELEQEAEVLEGELTRISSAFNQAKSVGNIKWNDVKKSLNKGEAAIEFAAFKEVSERNRSGKTIYYAIILKYDDDFPIMVRLFKEDQFGKILTTQHVNSLNYINSVYGTNSNRTDYARELFDLIWKPLENFLSNTNAVFISPAGLLHKVSFSAISKDENVFLSDIYDIHLISSMGKSNNIHDQDFVIENAMLFGGVNYGGNADNPDSWSYLEGTLIETKKLVSIFEKYNANVNYFTGNKASEAAFKEKAPESDLLHIATHGFFFPDPEKVREEERKKTTKGEVEFRGGEGFGVLSFKNNVNPLMRSGLVLAGANNVWISTERNSHVEDGVLTAHEVANLNLQNAKLVVLSACETGLGDIKGSEGVYGLQRAFKMAGAKYLIMSLWQVPDKETVEFMEIFYSKLLNYRDIRKAFSETQREMRQKYDPFFWAAFVLVE